VPADYTGLRVAPDDKHVAVTLSQGSGVDVWVLDVVRNATTQVTFNSRIPASSVGWSPDGRWVAYSANVGSSKLQLFHKSADGTGEERPFAAFSDRDEWFSDWSPNGRYLLFSALDPETHLDVWAVPSDGSAKPFAVARGPHDEPNGRFSPDGRWVAYISNESGRSQVYLVPFQHGQGKWQVSNYGGNMVGWARDGKTLYYTSGQNDMWSVRVLTHGDTVELSTPLHIFSAPIRTILTGSSFDVTRDGRFLLDGVGASGNEPMVLVQNWKALLNQ
jgi:eukaryotic-like serine/threonine-protein kinase